MPNAWFFNPIIQIQPQKSSEKETWEQEWKETPILVQGARTDRNMARKSKLCAPKCPRIVPRSPKMQYRQEACQMISLGNNNNNICSQQQKESQVSEEWAMVKGRRQMAQPILSRQYEKTKL